MMRRVPRVRDAGYNEFGISANPADPTAITAEWGLDLSTNPTTPPPGASVKPTPNSALLIGVLGLGWFLLSQKNQRGTGVINPALDSFAGLDFGGSLPLLVLGGGLLYMLTKKAAPADNGPIYAAGTQPVTFNVTVPSGARRGSLMA